MNRVHSPFIILIAFVLLFPSLAAQSHRGQAVTWGVFSYVRYVASSMSHTYYATSNGIIRYNKNELRWEYPLTGTPGINHTDISRVWVNTFDDELYAQTTEGYFQYNDLFESWRWHEGPPVVTNDTRHLSSLPIFYPPFGFNYAPDLGLIDQTGRTFRVTDVLDDGAGQLWIGTWGYGPATAGKAGNVLELLPYGLIQPFVYDIAFSDTGIWVGGHTGGSARTGLSVFYPESNEFDHVETGIDNFFPSSDVNCLLVNETTVMMGTEDGLYQYSRELEKVERRYGLRYGLADDRVRELAWLNDTVFVGTPYGLDVIAPDSDSVMFLRINSLAGREIYDLEVFDTTLWVVSEVGVFRYYPSTGKLQEAVDNRLAFAHQVESWDRDLWFALIDEVLRIDTRTGETETYPSYTHGVVPDALAVNESAVFIGSIAGLTMIRHDEKRLTTRTFTSEDGLPAARIRALEEDGDYVWVGSDGGLTRFLWNNPSRID